MLFDCTDKQDESNTTQWDHGNNFLVQKQVGTLPGWACAIMQDIF